MNRRMVLLIMVPLLLLACCVAGVAVGMLAVAPFRERVMAMLGLRQQTLAAELIPADAIFYASLSYNLQAQPGYETIRKAYLDNPKVKQALQDAKDNLKKEAKIEWDAEVAPWLGSEIGLAILSLSPEDLEGNTPPLVLLVASRDLNASNRFLERLRERAAEEGSPFEERTYGQTRYWFRPPEPGTQEPPILLATVRDFVVMATHEKSFQAVVDRAGGQGEPLSRSPRFQRVMGELPKQAVLLGYVDFPSLLEAYRKILAQTPGAPSL